MPKEPLRRRSFVWLVAMASAVVLHAPPLVAARCRLPTYDAVLQTSRPYHYALIYEDGTVRPAEAPVPVRVTVPPDLGQRCRRR